MKKIPFAKFDLFILLLIILPSCGNPQKQGNEVKKKNLVVVLYDISKSVDKYAILNTDHLKTLYYTTGSTGGGEFYGYLIKSSSIEQDPFTFKIPSLDTLVLNGNRYQINNQRKINEIKKKTFEKSLDIFLNGAKEALMVEKNQLYTDLQDAYELAKTTMEQSRFNNYKKELVIISDCIQDLPGRSGSNELIQFDLPNDIKILVVRPSSHIDIKSMFPANQVRKYVSINDAFQAL